MNGTTPYLGNSSYPPPGITVFWITGLQDSSIHEIEYIVNGVTSTQTQEKSHVSMVVSRREVLLVIRARFGTL